MAFCRNCGFQVEDTMTFCTNCGSKVWRPRQSVTPVAEPSPVQTYAPPEVPVQTYAPPEVPVQTYAPPEVPVQTYAPPEVPVQTYAPPEVPVQTYAPPEVPVQTYAPPEVPVSFYTQPQTPVYTQPMRAPKSGRGLGVASLVMSVINLIPTLIFTIIIIVTSIGAIVAYQAATDIVGAETMDVIGRATKARVDFSDVSGDFIVWYVLIFVLAIASVVLSVLAKKKGCLGGPRKGGFVLGVMEIVLCAMAGMALIALACIVG